MARRNSGSRRGFWCGSIIFALLLFSSSGALADWTPVIPPEVSSSWRLQGVHFHSVNEGWAVGIDDENKRGVSLRFDNGSWTVVPLPEVSSDWELHSVHFTSAVEGWAVGVDRAGAKGVLLRFTKGNWTAVVPPNVSLNWALYGVHFTSVNEGWAVGVDYSNQRGILLHRRKGAWTNVIPPDVSLNWGLYGVYFTSINEGWAVGVDQTNARGALLQFHKEERDKKLVWTVVTPPELGTEWELSHVHFSTAAAGWAVGINHTNRNGVLFHRFNDAWASIIPPDGSSDWELTGVQFTSPKEGWAVGVDHENRTGVLLRSEKGSLTLVPPPSVSSDWGLNGLRFTSENDGWAVGFDQANQRGVLLRYSGSGSENVSAPGLPDGPASGAPGVDYTYTAGGAASNEGHSVQYFIDWGDGTNSGWLPVGTTTASKNWASPGNFIVRAQARCAEHSSVVSKLSSGLTVNISTAPVTIFLQSPADGAQFSGCSLYSLPTFSWEAEESFTGYEIQFSKTENFNSISVKDSVSSTTVLIESKIWRKVLLIPGATGGPVYWRVVGTRANKSTAASEVFSAIVNPPQTVGNPEIADPSKGLLPTLSWMNNCNVRFKVWFGNDGNFSRKVVLSFSIKNPIDNGGPSQSCSARICGNRSGLSWEM